MDKALFYLLVGLGLGDGSASEGEPGHPIVIAEQQTQTTMRKVPLDSERSESLRDREEERGWIRDREEERG